MDLGRLLRTGAKGMGVGTALFGGTAVGLWWQLFRRPSRTSGDLRVPGLEGGIEIVRDRWGMPTVRAETAADLWYGQGFCHGQDRLWQMRRLPPCHRRTDRRDRRPRRPAGRPADAHPRPAPGGVREEAELDADLRQLLDAYCAGLNAGGARRLGTARGVPAAAPRLRALAPRRHARRAASSSPSASRPTGSASCCAPTCVRELGEERAARIDPTYPTSNPVVLHPVRDSTATACGWPSRSARVREQIGLATSGQRLQQLGGEAGPLGHGRRPARGRPAPARRACRASGTRSA